METRHFNVDMKAVIRGEGEKDLRVGVYATSVDEAIEKAKARVPGLEVFEVTKVRWGGVIPPLTEALGLTS